LPEVLSAAGVLARQGKHGEGRIGRYDAMAGVDEVPGELAAAAAKFENQLLFR
jgi:hypothetical protein